jgi:putative NADH-flavin reductase
MVHFLPVIGAAGNVGMELVKELSTAGAIFRAGVHSNKSADEIEKISSRAHLIEIGSYGLPLMQAHPHYQTYPAI